MGSSYSFASSGGSLERGRQGIIHLGRSTVTLRARFGKIRTGDRACDHYHRWQEDIALMKGMGLQGYRFSLSWPRIMPAGEGAVNPAGLAFYDRLIDGMLEAGVEPWVTLFHWDFPLELAYRGGWLNSRSPEWFADYARVVVDHFSDRVSNWMTLNEPQCFIGLLGCGCARPGLNCRSAKFCAPPPCAAGSWPGGGDFARAGEEAAHNRLGSRRRRQYAQG